MTVKELHRILSEQLYIGNANTNLVVIRNDYEGVGEIIRVDDCYGYLKIVVEDLNNL